MPSQINIACIGCGGIAGGYRGMKGGHLYALEQIPEVKIRALVDIDEERAKLCCELFGGEYWTTDADRALSDPEVDAVLVCTHHDSHADYIVRAAQASKHVFTEKPMCMTEDECDRIEEALKSSGVKLMVGFRFRFAPGVVQAKEVFKNPIVTVGQLMEDRWPDDLWAQDPVKGGGEVLSQGVHMFDLVYFMNESEPAKIHAVGGTLTHTDTEVIDNVITTIRFANGSIGVVITGDAGLSPYTSKFFVEVFEGTRTATIYDRLRAVDFAGVEQEGGKWETENFEQVMKEFIAAILEDRQPCIGFEDGKRATILALKSFESARTGQPVVFSL